MANLGIKESLDFVCSNIFLRAPRDKKQTRIKNPKKNSLSVY